LKPKTPFIYFHAPRHRLHAPYHHSLQTPPAIAIDRNKNEALIKKIHYYTKEQLLSHEHSPAVLRATRKEKKKTMRSIHKAREGSGTSVRSLTSPSRTTKVEEREAE